MNTKHNQTSYGASNQQIITSHELGRQLVNALNLSDNVTEIGISLRVGEPAWLTVRRLIGVDEAGDLVSELSRFGLVRMDLRDPIDLAASKAMHEVEAKYKAALDWLDAKHTSNCRELAAS